MIDIWTEEQFDELRELYTTGVEMADMVQMLGKSRNQIAYKVQILGLKRPAGFMKKLGLKWGNSEKARQNWFEKGHIPVNKGVKYTDADREKYKHTFFQPGHIPTNKKPVGSERYTEEGYVMIKTENGKWRLKNRVVWEQANGPVPNGYVVRHRNGDADDNSIENLYLVSRKDIILNENSVYAKYPEELQEVMRLKGRLTRMINKIEKTSEKFNEH